MQSSAQAHSYIAPVQGNGAGAASNANGIFFPGGNIPGGGFAVVAGPGAISGAAQADGGSMLFNGNVVLTFTMGSSGDGTVDHLYVDGVEDPGYSGTQSQSAGLQTLGNYQLGGCAQDNGFHTVDSGTYIRGTIYYAVFYSSMLTPGQVAANAASIKAILTNRGVFPFGLFNLQTNDQIAALGDSITIGQGGQPYTTLMYGLLNGLSSWKITNFGLGGYTAVKESVTTTAGFHVEPFAALNAYRQVMIYWIGTNDVVLGTSASTVFGYLNNISRYIRSKSPTKVIQVTMVSRTGFDTQKNALDTTMRGNWPLISDVFCDMASDPRLGADGASASLTWFQDGVHPTVTSQYNIMAPLITRAVNRIYGNLDFSAANVYTATRPVANISSISEVTNTVTVTTSSPHNFAVGEMVIIAGVTPSGYNSLGFGWQIITVTSTTFTYYNPLLSKLGFERRR
jgi:hypothetical protein